MATKMLTRAAPVISMEKNETSVSKIVSTQTQREIPGDVFTMQLPRTTRTGTHENSMKILLKPHELHHEHCVIGISLNFHIHEKAMKFVNTYETSL